MFNEYQHLRIPGPTPVSPEVQREMNRTILGHRSEGFSRFFAETLHKTKYIFQTKQDVFAVAASGTGALEMAVSNVVEAGDTVLVVVTGVFGERFAKIVKAYQGNAIILKFELGRAAQPQKIQEVLESHPEIKAIFVTHCETSTGVVNPIKKIGDMAKKSNALLIVDSVSALVGMDLKMDNWGIDIAVTAAHKALGLPPGLSLIAVSEKAWKRIRQHHGPRFYWDLLSYKKNIGKQTTPFTAPVSLIYGLSKSIDLIQQEGLEQGFQRHNLLRDMLRAAIPALNLELFVPNDEEASSTVTSIKGSTHLDVEELRRVLRENYKIDVAGGQQNLKGKIFRIGHMGYMHPMDMLTTIAGLEMALKHLSYPMELGMGIRAAEEVWLNAENIGQ
ncbi:alanine--glyoxylate aminotransferase family protein [Irregularibacter muris]|uniref:Alanine--glyoxylate aminotransferase family protein n=1 Tax=Irregularibacter muris TaxID=1796619 RepID=A0AAE3HGS1_9FIRM|nr:alanine--glyoxylate aminotransferase family protein [Irregularibacter muris]MCR1899154.1 alanine--glyoxylate aminotransferase family protein [Irregularibacter muris]